MARIRAVRRHFWLVLLLVLAGYLAGLLTGLLGSLLAWQFGVFVLFVAVVVVYLQHVRARWLRLVEAWREEIRNDAGHSVSH